MNRRSFLKGAAAGFAVPEWLTAASTGQIDLKDCVVIGHEKATAREKKALTVLTEEVEKRSQIRWPIQTAVVPAASTAIYAATRASARALGQRIIAANSAASHLPAEGYAIQTGSDAAGRWIAVIGADERGLLFGIGNLLRLMTFARDAAAIDPHHLPIATSPKYPLRGHQLGYRPKTNAYDAWTVADWDQYIRDLAIFGTNAIELMPPRSDDKPDSPHFPLSPEKMMIQMSRIADSYGLDVWIWYPAMDPDYADPATVESALKEWAHIYQILPRIDAIFVPGGDPGHTEPKAMLAFLEKQKESLRRYHPKAQMWSSPQGFRQEWLDTFFNILDQESTQAWLDGYVFGPQNRLSLPEIRKRLPKRYPIRFYPDITHSIECQYPVPNWDVAFALTEGRECINPRPEGEANILRRYSEYTIGFLTYSEGCNDDVNKFVWSALGWSPDMPLSQALREYANYFMGQPYAAGIAQGILDLEHNWHGPLATNDSVPVTLARFQDVERKASPALLENWRFQQLLYRAYYDAAVRSRLIDENARVDRALNLLGRLQQIGWAAEPLGIGQQPSASPPNGQDPSVLLDEAERILAQAILQPAGDFMMQRVRELGEALFQSIRMQLAVNRYQGEAVDRAANLETIEAPLTDLPWLRTQLAGIRKLASAHEQIIGIGTLLARTDPGPGGFYDELGNLTNRPHLILGSGPVEDPEFRSSALTGFSYPDRFGGQVPVAWKRWAGSLFDAPLKMHYDDLDLEAQYRIRIVYSGDARRIKIRLMANEKVEIHPLMTRPWPPQPIEFEIPAEATSTGQLNLAWTREQGLGGNGRGCQVSEVWILRK
ncbi:MAG TPA: hypothetical protein VGL97_21215 [Bryobacteraceae bacterium]